jgi:DNA-binding NarL/FixJ family response regulator
MSVAVVVVDDQVLVRTGFRMILEAEPDITIVGEAGDGDEAVEVVRSVEPDVVLMDVRMPGTDGIEATRRITAQATGSRVIMLTTFDMDQYVYDALAAGASGFLLKDVPPEQLIAGIHTVHAGESLLAPSITRRMIEAFIDRPRPGVPGAVERLSVLTPREREILVLLGFGLTNAEMAERLVLSETTIKTHVQRVLTKLQLRDRIQAVILAYESGLVAPGRSA